VSTAATKQPWNKGKRLAPEVLTSAEAIALMGACSKRAPTGLRNQALIVILWRGGLRIGEALALRPKDLDPSRGTVRVLNGKGGKSRVVGLDAEAWAVLQRWMEKRKDLGIHGHRVLFCTLKGTPLQATYVRSLLPRLAQKAQIPKRVCAHGLRHTHACELRAEGVDVGIISKQLGHSSIATTARYLDHIAPEQVVQAMRKRQWSPG
jgi:site-specific recombinase XerD